MSIRALFLMAASTLVLGASPAWGESYEARVVGVSAGDIFALNHDGKNELVVLYGVTAPSTQTLAGQEAQRFASDRVLRKRVKVRVVERREGLTLVEFGLKDGTNLGQLMLRKGLVKWDSLSAPHDEGLKELQRLAKADRRGLWYDRKALLEAGPEVMVEEVISIETPRKIPDRGGYRVLEVRVITDGSGVKTLIMRGNGKKQIGIEAAAAQRRIDLYMAEQEQARLAQEEFYRQQEEERLAAEEAWALEEERRVESERAYNETYDALLRMFVTRSVVSRQYP